MSRNPHDSNYSSYYQSSSHPNLPPIRTVFGDVLEQPVQYRSRPDDSNACPSRRHPQGSYSHQQSYTDPHLPPLRSHPADATPSRFSQTVTQSRTPASNPQQHSSQYYQARTVPRENREASSSHSFDVFQSTRNEGLVHRQSSSRDDFRQSAKEEAISLSTGRHACPECGRRFEKHSHFKNHMISHSGEKPYQCSWPGCGKTFSASSNMRRHERSHRDTEDSRRR